MDKSLEEKANPFFEEVQVNLAMWSVKDHRGQTIPPERELNMQSRLFDDTFNSLYDQLAVEAARGKIKSDSAILAFRSELPVTDNRYFNNYRWYRTGLLYYASQLGGTKYVSAGFFASHPILYDNDAYMELFNTTYDRYFMYFGRTREGEKIYDVINRQASFSRLKELLGEDEVFPSDSLLELVILKNLHDEFYADRFSRGALLRLVNSAMEQSSIEKHREIAGQIRAKITRLLPGFAPPAFSLYNQDSILVSPDTYKGKYTYLMFCTTQNYVCLSQYELLKELQRTHGQWLQIVVISVDDRFSNMRNFRNNHGYTWDFLHYANNPDIMKEYDVRIFPTCYLIDPEGKLVLSPAPAANDQIEKALYYELQNKKLWDEYIRKGWIVDGK